MTDVTEAPIADPTQGEDLATDDQASRTQSQTTRNVARRIKALRARRGWSAQKVSDLCGELGVPIERSVLAGLETGKRAKLAVDELMAFAAVFEVEPAFLLTAPGSRAVPIATELVGLLEKLADADEPDPKALQQAWSQYQALGVELKELNADA